MCIRDRYDTLLSFGTGDLLQRCTSDVETVRKFISVQLSLIHIFNVQTGDFAEEVEEIDFDQIPMLDLESAKKLGDRKMGELVDMVSQFEVTDYYSQINYQGRPVRVTPLQYGDLIKWFNNKMCIRDRRRHMFVK